jgi:hypothetical protein
MIKHNNYRTETISIEGSYGKARRRIECSDASGIRRLVTMMMMMTMLMLMMLLMLLLMMMMMMMMMMLMMDHGWIDGEISEEMLVMGMMGHARIGEDHRHHAGIHHWCGHISDADSITILMIGAGIASIMVMSISRSMINISTRSTHRSQLPPHPRAMEAQREGGGGEEDPDHRPARAQSERAMWRRCRRHCRARSRCHAGRFFWC